MRYAVFSDIHSNLEAYEAVLEAISKEKADAYYCCGDIVGYGADPAECILKTKAINPVIIAGNHDWASGGQTDMSNFTSSAKAAVLWTAEKLSKGDKEYLNNLRLINKDKFLMVHGSPSHPEEFNYVFGLNDAYPAFLRMQEENIRLCFIGHTHAAGVLIEDMGYITFNPWPSVKLAKGKKYIINVGSVGQPRDSNPRAAYCIYDTDMETIEIKRVEYDIVKAQEKIVKAGLPAVLAERLSLGK
ncbi:MAG: metallophosphoesterase family protein [Candidatus Omnitrophica bacterium]|nr:metallophosphoesterase family protein [Candidatus Omnitrophota bacterium]